MKTVACFVFILFSFQLYAACKCNCDPVDNTLCASSYDLEHPCHAMCSGQVARTACPTVKVFNQRKNAYEWISLCTE